MLSHRSSSLIFKMPNDYTLWDDLLIEAISS